jgi:hypothetical protein
LERKKESYFFLEKPSGEERERETTAIFFCQILFASPFAGSSLLLPEHFIQTTGRVCKIFPEKLRSEKEK